MSGAGRVRLDVALVEQGLVSTRNAARGVIMAGLVQVDGARVDKAGTAVKPGARIVLARRPRFVSRAGEKLAHVLDVFGVDVRGACAVDIGASTGGFVDCLLQAGAAEVVAVDVGYGQLDQRLRLDGRVHVRDRVNARYLSAETLPYVPDLLTADVSFISLRTVLPAVLGCMAPSFAGLLMVKPQFEAGPERVGKGGIVRSVQVRRDVLLEVAGFLTGAAGLRVRGVTDSGLPGAGGNVEFFFWAERGREDGLEHDALEARIESVSGMESAPPPVGSYPEAEGGDDA